jgi:hypothetical protein
VEKLSNQAGFVEASWFDSNLSDHYFSGASINCPAMSPTR